MKTNQIMIRPMGDFKVIQRTKDAFFNATNLLKQWNQLKGMKKEVNDYFGLASTKEFIYTIMERENYDRGNYPIINQGQIRGIMRVPGCIHYFLLTLQCG
ncbi:KilA-N domain-containing protein [Bacteroides fragilis]